ncbi:MAG: abortive infection family protein [Pseudomonadota bacterium]
MTNKVPNSVIGTVSPILAAHYYSHSTLNSLFMASGAPGEVPEGNCEAKCSKWLQRCNDDPSIDARAVLGLVIQKYMDQEITDWNQNLAEGQARIRESLAKNQLSYQTNGYITLAGASPATKTLADFLRNGDFASIEAEFNRTIAQINNDPYAAITAACSIIEALCKTYIETFNLEMPTKQTVVPLWRTIQQHLGLNIDSTIEDDQKRIIQGLASIVDGIGAYRTHTGSAHGRGITPPKIQPAEARLAVNASHTLVIFIMERWQTAKIHNNSFQMN